MIYIDASRANRVGKTGVEWYCSRFIEALGHVLPATIPVTLLLDSPILLDFPLVPSHWHIKVVKWPFPFWSLLGLSVFFVQKGFAKSDILWSPGSVPPLYSPRSIATVHDLGFLDVPQYYSLKERLLQTFGWWMTRLRAIRIITPSQFTADRVHAHTQIPTIVIHNAPAITVKTVSKPSHANYFLYLGRIEHKKNILGLIEGFTQYRASGGTQSLVLIGGNGFGVGECLESIKASPARDVIIVLGSQPESVVASYLSHATALVLYSWYEGFGMPLIESLCARVPVIASDIPVFHEILLDCGYFASPQVPHELAQLLIKVSAQTFSKQEKDVLYQQGMHYSWTRAATQLSEILQKMV